VRSPDAGHFESHHVLEKIRPCLDGELSAAVSEAVRSHCRDCPECARAWEELSVLADLLPSESLERESPSLWPAVRARLRARPPWLLGARFAVSASIAAVAGVVLGVLLGGGPGTERAAEAGGVAAHLETVWSENWEPTLADVYLAALTEESE
jgi:anti-sigma factor RsiW